jgi:hypothetical protein
MFPSIAMVIVLEVKSRRYFGLPSSAATSDGAAGGLDMAWTSGRSEIGEPVTDDM